MAKFMFSEIIGFASTYVEAKRIGKEYRKNNNEHIKVFIEGHTHCTSMGNPMDTEWCVQIWRHHNAKNVNKFIPLWF